MGKAPPRDIENKAVLDSINKETQNRVQKITFINQVWWIDLLVGLFGIAVIIYANNKLQTAIDYPKTDGDLVMLWIILHPIGGLFTIRVVVGCVKVIGIIYKKILRS